MEAAGAVLEEPEGDEAELRGEGFARLPDDLVDGVVFADGVHHLADEEGEAAGLVLVESVDDGNVIVELVEGAGVSLGLGGLFALEGLALELGDGFLAFAYDVAEDVVPFFHLIPREGGVADEAEEEVIEIDGKKLGGEAAEGVEAGTEGELDDVRGDQGLGLGRAFGGTMWGCVQVQV